MAVTHKSDQSSDELIRLVVEEVDEAREVLELARQLHHALPLRSFEDLIHAVGAPGTITFRGSAFAIRPFANYIPDVLFPVDSAQKLITLLAQTVRLAPPWITYPPDDTSAAKRSLRQFALLGVTKRIGVMGPPPGFGAGVRAGRPMSSQPPSKQSEG